MITKFTSGVRVLEPLALLGGSYLAYVTAELFHWYSLLFSPFWWGLILLLLCIRHCRTLSLVFSPSLLLFFLLVVLLFFPVSVGFNLTSATAEFVHSYCLLLVLFLLLVIVGGGDGGFDFFVHSLYFGNFILPQSMQNFTHPINAWKIVLIYNL